MRALVTGAAKRIGRAMALDLARKGYDVAVHYANSHDDAHSLIDEIKAMGRQAAPVQADLLIEEEMTQVISQARDALGGPIDVLVNNASIFEPDEIGTITRESWNRHLVSNLRAPVVLTQEFAGQPDLKTGVVVNMIDQRIRKLTPDFMSYTLAKSALWTFTQTAAQSLAPKIRVNAIGPGPTLANVLQTQEEFEQEKASTLTGKGASVEEICHALGYILQADSVTGQMICVDGGQHLARP